MSRNYDFIVNLAASQISPPAKLLDFGCGAGQVVGNALAAGYDAHGTDLFSGGWKINYAAAAAALCNRLHPMPSPNRLPFEDASFDIAISNQVFEHIEHKAPVIAELARVIRPGGCLIAIFPTREILIEPHLKAPLVHRLANGGALQKFVLTLSHRLGMSPPTPLSQDEWIAHAAHALQSDIFYSPNRAVPGIFSPAFTLIRQAEPDFMRDRINTSRLKPLAKIFNHRLVNSPLRTLCLRLANGVYVFSRT
jgi:SAM-dependent methyltransferase